MSKPVNLNRFRKEKARAAKKARADENATVYGLSKSERERAKALAKKAHKNLDGKQQE